MDKPRTRQRRLFEEPAPGSTNERVVRKPLLSASTLAAWFYCRTKPFVQRLLEAAELDVATPAMRAGAAAHEAVQGALEAHAEPSELTLAQALARKEFLLESETHLLDERRRLHGYVDLLFAHEGRLHILELKNTRGPRFPDPMWNAPLWPEHGVQLHFYGVLGRTEFGLRPRLALGYLAGGSKERVLADLVDSRDSRTALLSLWDRSVPVEHAGPQRARILEAALAFRRAERELRVPLPNHTDPARCARCTVNRWCPRRLDAPGRFERIPPNRLPDEGFTEPTTNIQ